MKGQISQTDSSINATKNIPRITSGLDRDVDVATEYKASINCDINLVDRHGRLIFSQTMGGEKVHLGAAQTGDAGATAPLINDSEHRMAIQFLAAQMMASVYQRMVDTF